MLKGNVRIFLDVETTGIKSYASHVIEVAAVATDESLMIVSEFRSLANPGEDAIAQASPEALEVNKIGLEEIRGAPPSIEAAKALRDFLGRWPQAQYHAFNNDFDLWFLARSPWYLSSRSWGECVMRAAQKIMDGAGCLVKFPDGNTKWPSLQEAAKYFEIPTLQTHRALDDARMAAQVYREVLRDRAEVQVADESRLIQEDGF